MATAITSSSTAPLDTVFDAFDAFTTLEKQIAFLCERLHLAEQTYNAANPDSPVNAITIAPDYNGNAATITITLPLSTSAPSLSLSAGVSALAY